MLELMCWSCFNKTIKILLLLLYKSDLRSDKLLMNINYIICLAGMDSLKSSHGWNRMSISQ